MSLLIKSISFFKDREVFSGAKLPLLILILFAKPLQERKHHINKRKWEKNEAQNYEPFEEIQAPPSEGVVFRF